MSNGIGKNPLNDISKAYLKMRESYKVEPPQEKLKTDRNMFNIPKDEQQAAKERLLAKTKAKRAKMKEGLDPVGKEDGDVNNDGKKDSSDSYLLKRRKAIAKAMKTRKEELEMQEGIRDEDPEKGTAERKARLEKKRGMKMDDHPQYKKEEVEVDEAMSSYDRNRKRAAQRAADRNAARAAGKTGVVPGVGYVSPRKERETYVDSAGTTRHKSGAKMAKEGFSNWRTDLIEVMDEDEADKPVKEKKVNNRVKINPKLGEAIEEIGGTLIEEIEIDELDVIIESVYEELIEEGYSEDDVEDAIEFALTEQLNEVSDSYYDSAVKSSKAAAGKIKRAEMMKKAKGRLKFMKRKAGEVAGKVKRKAAGAVAGAAMSGMMAKDVAKDQARRTGRAVKQAVTSAPGKAKKSIKGRIKKAALGVAKRMSEDTQDLQELPIIQKAMDTVDALNRQNAEKVKRINKTLGRDAVSMPKTGTFTPKNEEVIKEVAQEKSLSPAEIALQKKKGQIDMQILKKRKQAMSDMKNEEASDAMKDRRMERGGVDGNTRYDRPPGKPNTFGKKKPRSGGMSALDLVKADIRSKYGKGAIMDTKKK